MELLILGLALGVGASRRKEVTKAVVKGYMAVSEKTREVTAHLKEDMRDAVEEARFEQDLMDSDSPASEMDTETERTVLHEETLDADATQVTIGAVAVASVEAGRKAHSSLLKGLAKSYMTLTEKTRATMAQMREEMRDAVEEARFEREQATAKEATTLEIVPELEIMVSEPAVAAAAPTSAIVEVAAPVKRRRRTTAKPIAVEAGEAGEVKTQRRRPAAKKETVEAAPVKTSRRSKPKTAKTAESETSITLSERLEPVVEAAPPAAVV